MRRFSLRRSVKRVLLFTHIGAAIALLLSANSFRIDPNTFLWPAFLGLSFLPILAVNMGFMVFWLFTKPRFGFIGLLALVLTWGAVTRHINLWPTPPERSETDIEIMSMNVRLFDLYNWGGNKQTRNQIFQYLEKQDPGIICFQELFHTNDRKYFNTLDTLKQFLAANQVHDHYTAILHSGKSKFGIATLSQYPVTGRGVVPLDTAANNAAIFTDVVIGEDTIRIFNIHLASVHISGIEQDLSKHIENNDQDAQWQDIQRMTKQLSGGFKRRAKQSDVIRTYMDESPYPIIVCGDLNDTPGSYAYATISEGLNDAFLDYGKGLGASYLGLFPALRIDFILVDPSLQLTSFSTEDVKLSDHRPLVATFR